ncbi:MAG: hypothetical protein IPM71_01715 [Bacteroidota bacterium]|nr:MAG: hypothetical protein IPM71_01715 [Bacteroidota bacterium]
MKYTEIQQKLARAFKPENELTELKELNLTIHKYKFQSPSIEDDIPEFGGLKGLDTFIGYNSLAYRNLNFNYYIFQPDSGKEKDAAIILLHGLNERSWEKYLSWAYALASKTGKSVILFPIAFHMNRSPEAWHDARQMSRFVEARKKSNSNNENLSFANIAISERLTYAPEQFFLSGYQSAKDIYFLAKEIKQGNHKLFNSTATIDFFGYSFGAFLEEILAIANPEGYFTNSKFFFFCGGCVFSEFNGTSKYILDQRAFERIRYFYVEELDIELRRSTLLSKLLNDTAFGYAFRHICSLEQFSKLTVEEKNRMDKNIVLLALQKDEIVSPLSLKNTFPKKSIDFIDFDFEYSHEVPFPVNHYGISEHVDKAFEDVFSKAAVSLS